VRTTFELKRSYAQGDCKRKKAVEVCGRLTKTWESLGVDGSRLAVQLELHLCQKSSYALRDVTIKKCCRRRN